MNMSECGWTNKRRRGRPCLYFPGRGEEIIAIMSEGYSVTAAAGAMALHRDTIYHWARTYPDFSDAFEVAKALRVFKLEADLFAAQDAATVRRCIRALKNADPEEWNKARRLRRRSARLKRAGNLRCNYPTP